MINEEKSDWVPSQFPLFLGSSLDLVRLLAFPSEDRIDRLQRLIRRVLKSPASPARLWRSLFGHLASMIQLVPGARRHIRPLQYFVQERWDMSMPESTPVFLTPAARETLQWWLHTPNLMSGVPFSDPVPEMTIVTDASSYGWGGHLGDQTASGTWQPQEKSRHINWLELQAVWLTLQHFLPQLGGTVVEVLSDNMTTVSYINKQGGTHSLLLCRLALDLWEWCDEHRIVISAVHLAGESNILADALSRGNYCPTEWTLNRLTFESLWQVWERPFVDMFASAKNAQLPVYYCLGADPQASGSNGLTMNWDMVHGYAFPPIALIPRVLRKLLRHPSATIVLLAPFWPSQIWFRQMTNLGDTRVLPGAGATKVDCVEALRRSILAQGFSEKVADTAAKGHRESTRRVYGARASHFARWCAARAVDPYTAPVTEVADFLTDLSKMPHEGKPMAHSTIVGYRTAIASIHSGFEGGVSVSSHPVLSALMKGIYVDRAQVRTLRPTWDLPKVLEHLSKSPFEPMAKASLRDLSIKTAFLVQLASGRRGSWMHACKVDEGHLRKETGGWRLLPALLLDKNQGPGFTPSSVFLSSLKDLSPDDRLHCPVRALNWYISRTKEVRGNERFLFISSKEPHNRAAQSTIAGWVREAINSVYRHLSSEERRALGIRAHDTRGVAASWALLAGVPIQEMMDAAAWKTPVTFARHYLKDLPNLKGRFGRAIISTAGSSGGAKTTTA